MWVIGWLGGVFFGDDVVLIVFVVEFDGIGWCWWIWYLYLSVFGGMVVYMMS